MNSIFKVAQANDGTIQSGNIMVPLCGNQHVTAGAVVAVEIDQGKVKLLVYGDINSKEPTHIIDLSGAMEINRKRVIEKLEEPEEIFSDRLIPEGVRGVLDLNPPVNSPQVAPELPKAVANAIRGLYGATHAYTDKKK